LTFSFFSLRILLKFSDFFVSSSLVDVDISVLRRVDYDNMRDLELDFWSTELAADTLAVLGL
jgi:predicted aconitase